MSASRTGVPGLPAEGCPSAARKDAERAQPPWRVARVSQIARGGAAARLERERPQALEDLRLAPRAAHRGSSTAARNAADHVPKTFLTGPAGGAPDPLEPVAVVPGAAVQRRPRPQRDADLRASTAADGRE